MPAVSARGAASVTAISDGGASTGGMFDTSTPAGWFHLMWWGSVLIILFFLWAL